MGGDEPAPARLVRSLDDGADPVQRHVEIAGPPDDLGRGDLFSRVAAVTGGLVDFGWLEEPHPVIVAQRLHAQKGGLGKVTDRQRGGHKRPVWPLPQGESQTASNLLTFYLWHRRS